MRWQVAYLLISGVINMRNFNLARIGVLAGGSLLPVLAMAQSTDPDMVFSTAVSDVSEKIGTYGAALVGVAAVGLVFAIAIKYVKKIRGAA